VTRLHRPAARPPETELGAVVHGPAVLARSPGIAAGLRCVFAHPTCLHLPLRLLAEGVQAEAAVRRSEGGGRPTDEIPEATPRSSLQLTIEVDGESRTADPAGATWSGGSEHFSLEAGFWVGALPRDGRLTLTAGWPEAGLAPATTVLELDLDDLAGRVRQLFG
jgi:hypothetical protein